MGDNAEGKLSLKLSFALKIADGTLTFYDIIKLFDMIQINISVPKYALIESESSGNIITIFEEMSF